MTTRLAILFLLARAGYGQFAPAPVAPRGFPSFHHARGHMVELDALVTDAAGRIAQGLTAADFSLESGKPLKIASCGYVDTSARRTIVFVVDDLALTEEAIDNVRAALQQFLPTLHAGDRIAILRSGSGEGELQQLTNDPKLLGQAIARLYFNPRRAFFNSAADRAGVFNTGAMGVLRVAIAGLNHLPGHKWLVLLSPNLHEQPVTALEALASAAKQAAVSVYGIDPSPPAPSTSPARTAIDSQGMASLARRTGGELLDAGSALPQALAHSVGGPDGYYRILYAQAESEEVPRLKASRPGIQILSTHEPSETPGDLLVASPEQGEDDLPRAMSQPFSTGQIRTRLTPIFYNSPQGSTIAVMVHLDARDLAFRQDLNGIYHAGARVLVASFGATGPSLQHQEWGTSISWDHDQYQQGLRTGVMVTGELPVRMAERGAGPAPLQNDANTMLQIRTVVSDDSSGRLGSAASWLEVPGVEDGRMAISGVELTGPGDASAAGWLDPAHPHTTEPQFAAVLRTFRGGQPITYRCELYNLTAGADKLSRIQLQAVFYREGKMTVANQPVDVELRAARDPRRIPMTGQITLPANLEPGRYVMRFGVTDKLAPADPPRIAIQFVDLELVP